jgi:uncharacterized membrane protein
MSAFVGGLFLAIILKSLGFSKAAYFSFSLLGALGGYTGFMMVLNSYFKKQKERFRKISTFITGSLSKSEKSQIQVDEQEEFHQETSLRKNKLTH